MKVLNNILRIRRVPYAQEILEYYQCCSRKGRSITDNLFILKCVLEKLFELNLHLYVLFTCFKQAYEAIYGRNLYEIFKEFGIPNI